MIHFSRRFPNSVQTTPLQFASFLFIGVNLPNVALPFAILAAGLYTGFGLGVYLFYVVGALLVSLLAHRLSEAVKESHQRSQELAHLEALGRSIIDAPPDALDHYCG